jgi:hypothetical protein
MDARLTEVDPVSVVSLTAAWGALGAQLRERRLEEEEERRRDLEPPPQKQMPQPPPQKQMQQPPPQKQMQQPPPPQEQMRQQHEGRPQTARAEHWQPRQKTSAHATKGEQATPLDHGEAEEAAVLAFPHKCSADVIRVLETPVLARCLVNACVLSRHCVARPRSAGSSPEPSQGSSQSLLAAGLCPSSIGVLKRSSRLQILAACAVFLSDAWASELLATTLDQYL